MKTALESSSPRETRRIAARLLATLTGPAVLALHGELGSGKTCFVQGLAAALGVAQPVTSPTFTLINEYAGARRLYHIDLYRVRGPDEVLALGFEEYLEAGGVVAVEWPERAAGLIPPHAIHVTLAALDAPGRRSITIERPETTASAA